jgi:tyrosine-protein kinase Etk/Wzc
LGENNAQEASEGIDFGVLISTLMESKRLIIKITSIAFFLGVVKSEVDPLVYDVEAVLQIQETSNSLAGLNPLSGLMEQKMTVPTQIEIIKSRMVLDEVITKLNMDIVIEPNYFSFFGKAVARKYVAQHKDEISPPLFGKNQYAWGSVFSLETSLELTKSIRSSAF